LKYAVYTKSKEHGLYGYVYSSEGWVVNAFNIKPKFMNIFEAKKLIQHRTSAYEYWLIDKNNKRVNI